MAGWPGDEGFFLRDSFRGSSEWRMIVIDDDA